MLGLPVHCDNCGLDFEGRGIAIAGNVENLTLRGNRESCPRCGAMAHIVEGTYNVRDGVLQALSATPLDRALLERLMPIVQRAQAGEIPPEEAGAEIGYLSPELASAFARVPPRLRAAFVQLLILVLGIIGGQLYGEWRDDSVTQSQLEQSLDRHDRIELDAIEQAFQQAADSYRRDSAQNTKHRARALRKAGRNDLCPCGSGRKSKHCCGG